jgi:hypothetical protein
MKARLKAKYPAVARMLHDLKRRDHSRAACLMQNYEATLFIHRVCGRIMKERPDLILFTIHDSILTTRDNVAYVKRVFTEEFNRVGISPCLREEDYGAIR